MLVSDDRSSVEPLWCQEDRFTCVRGFGVGIIGTRLNVKLPVVVITRSSSIVASNCVFSVLPAAIVNCEFDKYVHIRRVERRATWQIDLHYSRSCVKCGVLVVLKTVAAWR